MKVKNIIIILAMLLCLSFKNYGQWGSATLANRAYTTGPFAESSNLLVGQCTWFVYGRIQETGLMPYSVLFNAINRNGNSGIFRGNANTWHLDADSAGISTGYTAAPGALAIYYTGNNHVAFIDAINLYTEFNNTPRVGDIVLIGRDGTLLRNNYSTSSTIIWEMPRFTTMTIISGPAQSEGYQWFQMTGNGRTGWVAWLQIDLSGPAKSGDYWWNFTRIKLSPGTPFFISQPDIYIYPNAKPISPTNNSTNISTSANLTWSQVNGATYWLQVSKNSSYSDLVVNQKNITSTSNQVQLLPNTKYWWRVHIGNSTTPTSWEGWNFTTQGSTPVETNNIVFATNRDKNWEIYSMKSDGTNLVNLTKNSADDSSPVWSPDSKRIVFVSNRDGNNEIYVMNSDGSQQTRLTNNSFSDSGPAVSPDGRKIAFTTNRDGQNEIYIMNADGGDQVNVTNNLDPYDGDPTWSPDGTKIAFSSWRSGDARIWIMNSDGSNPKMVPNTISWVGTPRWSPDGKKLAYTGWGSLYSINIDGTNPVELIHGQSGSPAYYCGSWSPDGNKIVLFSNVNGNFDIYTVNIDGTNLQNITNNVYDDVAPSWTSNKITYVEKNKSTIPKDILLSQNYPNPFNPSTTIQFSIPYSQYVNLKVHDILGREVAILVNEEKMPGNYEVKFNVETFHGTSLPSGVYLYRLQAGSFSQTKKLLLLK